MNAALFWTHVQKSDGCWVWTGFCNHARGGYGVWGRRPRRMTAHRAAWILTHGPIPDGQSVLHHCDNPPCVRPDHLFLGTQRDNMKDCIAKKRNHVLPSMHGQVNPRWRGGRAAYFERRKLQRRTRYASLKHDDRWRAERNRRWRENYSLKALRLQQFWQEFA